jgi:hypothetical protein
MRQRLPGQVGNARKTCTQLRQETVWLTSGIADSDREVGISTSAGTTRPPARSPVACRRNTSAGPGTYISTSRPTIASNGPPGAGSWMSPSTNRTCGPAPTCRPDARGIEDHTRGRGKRSALALKTRQGIFTAAKLVVRVAISHRQPPYCPRRERAMVVLGQHAHRASSRSARYSDGSCACVAWASCAWSSGRRPADGDAKCRNHVHGPGICCTYTARGYVGCPRSSGASRPPRHATRPSSSTNPLMITA